MEINSKEGHIAVVGMGPGMESMMTQQALQALDAADVIVGYTVYLELLGERFAGKEFLSTPMKQEKERCRLAFAEALKGKSVAMVCSGDAGIYGMASLMFEVKEELGSGAADISTAQSRFLRHKPVRSSYSVGTDRKEAQGSSRWRLCNRDLQSFKQKETRLPAEGMRHPP